MDNGAGLGTTWIIRMLAKDARALEGHVDGFRRRKTLGRKAKRKDARAPLEKLLILTVRAD
eukprot:9086354-Pyramimonas_sp.AAC.1